MSVCVLRQRNIFTVEAYAILLNQFPDLKKRKKKKTLFLKESKKERKRERKKEGKKDRKKDRKDIRLKRGMEEPEEPVT